MAVADYLQISYSHDGSAPVRRVRGHYKEDAAVFLKGAWAKYLADLVGLEAAAIWREASRLASSNLS